MDFHASAPDTSASGAIEGPASGLRLALLGGFRIWLDGQPVPESAFPRRRPMSLLKFLALQSGYRAHREQVLEALWPDLRPDSAGAQLYKAVHHARQALAVTRPSDAPDDILFLRGEVLGLAASTDVTVDVEDFEELARQALGSRDPDLLRQAIDLYHGDLLPSDLYEPWTTERRDALRETLTDLLVDLGETRLGNGALAEAADALRQAVTRNTTREDAHRGLMLVYARQGNRSRALRQYESCVNALRSELGVPVAPETQTRYDDIRAGRVQQVEVSRDVPTAGPPVQPPIVGRQPELRLITSLLNGLGAGHGAVLGLEGEAGIGKTRLAQEIARLGWQRHWHVLYGAAHEQEGQPPYLPVVEALRQALWIDPAGADLIPGELAGAIPEIPVPAATTGVTDRLAAQSALFAGVLRFLNQRAQSAPVILILDDLHAVDDGSLKLFHYLARETANLPLLLVGSWRQNDPLANPNLAGITGNLEREHLLRCLALDPLTEREHQSLLEQALMGGIVDPALAGRLYHSSEGNALFALEMARQLASDGRIRVTGGRWRLETAGPEAVPAVPRSLRALAARRLQMLSAGAVGLLQLAATIGRDIPLTALEHGMTSAGLAAEPFLDLIDETLRSGMLVESGLDLRFPHALLREAIYDRMSLARRTALHTAVAGVFETLNMPVEAIAYQYRRAGNTDRAIHYLIQAGDRAEAVYDHDDALTHYGDALAMLDNEPTTDHEHQRSLLLERVGDVRRAIGDVERSLDAYLQALDAHPHTDQEPDRRRRFTLHRKITLGAILTVNIPVAAEHLAHARELTGTDPVDRAQQSIAEALFHWHTLSFESAIEHASEALRIAERAGANVEASQACEMLAIAHMPLGNWQESLAYELRRQTADWSPEIVVAIDAHMCLYQYKLHNEESLQQVRRFIEEIAQQSTSVGNLRCLAVCHFVLGNLAMLQGQPLDAVASLERSMELHERIGSPAGMAYTIAQQAALLTAAGVHAPVPQLVERGVDVAGRASIRDHCLTQLYTAGIRSLLETGDLAGAGALAGTAKAHDDESAPCAVCRVDLYEALAAHQLATGSPETAMAYIDGALQLADYAHNAPGRATLVRMRGHVHRANDELVEAERCFAEAAQIFLSVGDHYDLARTLHSMGTLDDAPGRDALRVQADEVLRRYRDPALAAVLAQA
ncbi:MAG TPA: BTAD domain-containing putative transcriptional regulator [Thermomicrobiales bacterium]|nr:BTAD domain-containing putative transcriptional regulator [Thermomicrobiales bacterium]